MNVFIDRFRRPFILFTIYNLRKILQIFKLFPVKTAVFYLIQKSTSIKLGVCIPKLLPISIYFSICRVRYSPRLRRFFTLNWINIKIKFHMRFICLLMGYRNPVNAIWMANRMVSSLYSGLKLCLLLLFMISMVLVMR